MVFCSVCGGLLLTSSSGSSFCLAGCTGDMLSLKTFRDFHNECCADPFDSTGPDLLGRIRAEAINWILQCELTSDCRAFARCSTCKRFMSFFDLWEEWLE